MGRQVHRERQAMNSVGVPGSRAELISLIIPEAIPAVANVAWSPAELAAHAFRPNHL